MPQSLYTALAFQDKKSADTFENAMTVMQITPLLKTAMRQLKGIKIEATDEDVVLTLLSSFSWFKVQPCQAGSSIKP